MFGATARKWVALPVAIVAATALTACSAGSAASSDNKGPDGTGYNGAALKKTAGQEVLFGLVNQEGAASGDFTQAAVGTQVAADYINKELGGVSGRPMKVQQCITDGTPEKSQSCANKFISDKVLSVMTGIDLGAPVAVPIYEGAKVPLTFGAPAQAQEYTSPNGFYSLGGGPTQVSAVARFVKSKLNATSVVVLGLDDPGSIGSYDTFLKGPFKKLGVASSYLGAPQGTADFSTQAQQAVSRKPSAIVTINGPQDCMKVVKALKGAGNTAPVVGTGSCVVPDLFGSANAIAQGFYVTGETQQLQQSPETEELKQFLYAFKRYSGAASSTISAFTLLGFQSTMNLWELSNTIGAEKLTSASITAFMKSTKDQHNWLSTPYTCAGPPVPSFAAICHVSATMFQVKDKTLVDIGSFEGLDLI